MTSNAQTTALIPAAAVEKILTLDKTAKQARAEIAQAEQDGNDMLKALILARYTQNLREQLTPEMMRDVRALMNTPLGFRTDRDPRQVDSKTGKPYTPYGDEVIRDCAIVAMIDGARFVGNEWNIIATLLIRWPECRSCWRSLTRLER